MTWINHPLTLESKNVKLTPLAETHFPELLVLGEDKRIWEFMPIDWLGKKNLKEVLHDAIKGREDGSQYPFVAIDKSTDKIFGSTRYLRINPDMRNLEIGWTWYHPNYWRTSYNKECKYLLLQHAFENLSCISINLGTMDTNIRSRQAIESLGAKLDGVMRNRLIWNNVKRNFALYSITDEEWPEIKKVLASKIGFISSKV